MSATATLVLSGLVSAGSPAASLPAQWTALTVGGIGIGDAEGDGSGPRDIVGDGANPTAFVQSDASEVSFRIRLDEDPRVTAMAALQPFGWAVEIEADGNVGHYDLLAMAQGASNPGRIELWRNTTQGVLNDPADPAESRIHAADENFASGGNIAVTLAETNFGGTPDFFLDFAIPRSAWEPQLPATTILRFAVGSNNGAANLTADLASSSGGSTLAALLSDPLVCGPTGCAPPTCDGRPATSPGSLAGTNGDDVIIGTSGIDVINGQGGNDTICGDGGNDVINGQGGNDTICGDGGNDAIDGGTGSDTVDGGTGIDRLSYSSRTEPVQIRLFASGHDDGGASDGLAGSRDSVVGIENVTAGSGADLIIGDGGANVLIGLGGNDTLMGGVGNDTLAGGANDDTLNGSTGADRFDGGTGVDVVSYTDRNSSTVVTIDGVANDGYTADGPSTARDNVLTSVENLTGGGGNDILKGNGANNRLIGMKGADSLYGLGGNDTLHAKDGIRDVRIDGGAGTDAAGRDSIDPVSVSIP